MSDVRHSASNSRSVIDPHPRTLADGRSRRRTQATEATLDEEEEAERLDVRATVWLVWDAGQHCRGPPKEAEKVKRSRDALEVWSH